MNTIITIGRQFGSGGREIGEKVAERYGIKYYDKDLIAHVASNSGFCKEMIEQQDERATKKLADEGPAVFIGRCADNALSERDNVINIFIHADEDSRIDEIMRRYPDINTRQKARDFMNKKDRQRQSYYNYYSSRKWGRADTYDFSINSALLGIDGAVNLICQMVDDFEKAKAEKANK